jgi:enediyne biosynthesis protein E7
MAADLPQNQPPEAELQFDVGGTDDSLERMVELFARLGDTYRVYVPSRKAYTYVVHHPDDIKRVLVTHHRNYTKGVGLDRVKILLGKGIMTSEGELWKRQRYMMQPYFHRRVLAQFAQLVSSVNEQWLLRWEPLAAAGQPVNITDEVSDLTLDIVLHSIFGSDLDRMTAAGGGVNPFEVVAKDTGRNLQFAFKFRSLTKLVSELIARRRTDGIEHVDFLAMLMGARDKDTGAAMGERELIDELMTLVVAGHETTASALNWTWYLLATHPQAQERLAAEVRAAPEHQAPGLEQMEALAYTGFCVNEALRLYPPGWVLSRRTIEADVLGGYEIPPGTNVLLPLYLLHRHPHFWKDPDLFWPERFAPEHEAERPRFAYMPFAAGPRHCIGETLAVYEMLVHLYKAARRYRVARAPGAPPGQPELEAQINLRTRHPLYMTLERR